MVKIQVLFFAKAKELVNLSETEIELSQEQSVTQLFEALELNWPELKQFKRTFALAHNEEYLDLDSNVVLQNGDVIAIIPPISGG